MSNHGQQLSEIKCKPGSFSVRLAFASHLLALGFHKLFQRGLEFQVDSGPFAVAPHPIRVRWPRSDEHRANGKIMAAIFKEVERFLDNHHAGGHLQHQC